MIIKLWRIKIATSTRCFVKNVEITSKNIVLNMYDVKNKLFYIY